jgi:hypothetical protein
MDFGDAWHDESKGDMHFWSVWHEGRDFDHYRDISPRFCSEFGFQSYPSLDVIRRFADPKDFNIAAPVMESHQKNAGGNARIAETMFRYFRFPMDFENFVYLSQVQQGLAIKTAVTHWRSLKPHCMGTLIWQLNDTWPVCSWSSLDHGGGWKLMHHMSQRFYAPIFVSAVPVGDQIELRAINDTGADLEIVVGAAAVDMAGKTRPLARDTVMVPAGGAPAAKPPIPLVYSRSLTYVDEGSAWNFSAHPPPSGLIINLGTNDVGYQNFNASFVEALSAFLVSVSSSEGVYANAPGPPPRALCWCGPITGAYCTAMQLAVEKAVGEGADAAFLGFVASDLDGCDNHPGQMGQRQLGEALVPLIKGALGW